MQFAPLTSEGLVKIQNVDKSLFFLEKHNYDICLLQETHPKIEVESLWTRESKKHIFFSGRSSTSGDVCTLVKQSLKFKFIYHKEIIPGKIQAIKFNIDDHDIVFCKYIWSKY